MQSFVDVHIFKLSARVQVRQTQVLHDIMVPCRHWQILHVTRNDNTTALANCENAIVAFLSCMIECTCCFPVFCDRQQRSGE